MTGGIVYWVADDADAAFVETLNLARAYGALPPIVAATPEFKPCAKEILRIIKSVPLSGRPATSVL